MYKNELVNVINNQLKGALIERGINLQIEWQIRDAIKGCFSEKHYHKITVDKDKHANYCVVRYNGYYLFSLQYTKQQGEYHCKYFSNYYDYYFKKFTSKDEDFNLEQKIQEIEIQTIEDEEKRQDVLNEMAENYQKIHELFGDKTDEIIHYIEKYDWKIRNLIDQQKNKGE